MSQHSNRTLKLHVRKAQSFLYSTLYFIPNLSENKLIVSFVLCLLRFLWTQLLSSRRKQTLCRLTSWELWCLRLEFPFHKSFISRPWPHYKQSLAWTLLTLFQVMITFLWKYIFFILTVKTKTAENHYRLCLREVSVTYGLVQTGTSVLNMLTISQRKALLSICLKHFLKP